MRRLDALDCPMETRWSSIRFVVWFFGLPGQKFEVLQLSVRLRSLHRKSLVSSDFSLMLILCLQVNSTTLPGYMYCEPYPQVPSLNSYILLTGVPSDWYNFIDYEGNNLGLQDTSPLFYLKPDFLSCDRSLVGPQEVNDTLYFSSFNIQRPDGFVDMLHMNTHHLMDPSFQGESNGPVLVG